MQLFGRGCLEVKCRSNRLQLCTQRLMQSVRHKRRLMLPNSGKFKLWTQHNILEYSGQYQTHSDRKRLAKREQCLASSSMIMVEVLPRDSSGAALCASRPAEMVVSHSRRTKAWSLVSLMLLRSQTCHSENQKSKSSLRSVCLKFRQFRACFTDTD